MKIMSIETNSIKFEKQENFIKKRKHETVL